MISQYASYNRSVLQLAVPSILANITIPLVGIVDVAILGHISDAAAVGGIAIGTMLFDLLYWNFGFLRVGTSGLTAQAVGRGDHEETVRLLRQSVLTAFIAAAGIWLLQWLFVTIVLWCVPCSDEVAAFARDYFYVRIWAAPATLALMALKGWFIGMQNTVAPMITDIVVNVVNMVASLLAVLYLADNPIKGVALGTLIAQYTGLLTAGLILAVKYRKLLAQTAWSKLKNYLPNRSFFALNIRLFERSLGFMVVYVGYTYIASLYGDEELAVSNILMKFFMLFSYFIDGFAYAGEALAGKLGAKQEGGWSRNAEVDKVVGVLFVWAIGIGLLFSAFYYGGADWLVGMMTTDAALRHAATPYYIWLALMPLVSALAFMWDGVYIGATDGLSVRNCMLWAAAAFVVSYISSYTFIGIQALYLGYFMHLLVRTIYLTARWPKMAFSKKHTI